MPLQMFAVKHDDLVDFQATYYIYAYTRVSPNISLVMQYRTAPTGAILFTLHPRYVLSPVYLHVLHAQQHACTILFQPSTYGLLNRNFF